MIYCPLCGGEGEYIGILGFLQWWRCRNCGAVYHKLLKKRIRN